MMNSLNKIAFLLDGFELRTPGQQLLDRFLIGYTKDGQFQPAPKNRVTVLCPPHDELNRRAKDFGLRIANSASEAIHNADGIVVVGSDRLIHEALKSNSRVFAYGAGRQEASPTLLTGTVTLALPQLPSMNLPNGARFREALIVVQGKFPDAELEGLDGLYRFSGADVVGVRHFAGEEVWNAGDRKEWSWDLLRAALSRTDKPQGHALQDGRTEDMVGLGLVRKMAISPRAWLLQHRHGLRSTILVLDGVIGDTVLALEAAARFGRRKIHSTQLFRSPSPQEEHFSRLAAVIEDFLIAGKSPWSSERTAQVRRLMDRFANPQSGSRL